MYRRSSTSSVFSTLCKKQLISLASTHEGPYCKNLPSNERPFFPDASFWNKNNHLCWREANRVIRFEKRCSSFKILQEHNLISWKFCFFLQYCYNSKDAGIFTLEEEKKLRHILQTLWNTVCSWYKLLIHIVLFPKRRTLQIFRTIIPLSKPMFTAWLHDVVLLCILVPFKINILFTLKNSASKYFLFHFYINEQS